MQCWPTSMTRSALASARRRRVGRQRARVRELPLHRARLDDRDLRLLGEPLQRVPGLGVEDAVARHDDRPLGPCGSGRPPSRCPSATDAASSRCGSASCRRSSRGRSASLKRRRRDLGRKVEVHRPRHAALQLPERVAGVLVHARGMISRLPYFFSPSVVGCW